MNILCFLSQSSIQNMREGIAKSPEENYKERIGKGENQQFMNLKIIIELINKPSEAGKVVCSATI